MDAYIARNVFDYHVFIAGFDVENALRIFGIHSYPRLGGGPETQNGHKTERK
jgi:hypothetical protein